MSARLKGTARHNMDAKGRLSIPAKMRDGIGKEFVVTRGLEKCLYVYSLESWDVFTEKLDALGDSKANVRTVKRFFQANAEDCELDAQGRTLIPPELRKMAGLEKEVVIVGNGNKLEIWSAEEWDKLSGSEEMSSENIQSILDNSDFDF